MKKKTIEILFICFFLIVVMFFLVVGILMLNDNLLIFEDYSFKFISRDVWFA